MSKFKVGDRVYAKGNIPGYEGPGTIAKVDPGHPNSAYAVQFDGQAPTAIWAYNEMVRPLEQSRKILIITDGITTTARMYEGKEVAKSAEAKCSPDDEFDFRIGARLAFNRLLGTDYNPSEMALKGPGEPVKLYCVEDKPPWMRRGRVYKIEGGKLQWSNRAWTEVNSFEELQQKHPTFAACLVPLVKRPAKVGEWVLVVRPCCALDRYKENDVLLVAEAHPHTLGNRPHVKVRFGEVCASVFDTEYLVLEGYQPEPEQPKYYSGKVVCVSNGGSSCWTVGKVYEFKDGYAIADGGARSPMDGADKGPITSFGELAKRYIYGVEFIEFLGEAD